ncbi:hypothetical protein PUR61_07250 [Streptomyces sp. BE20]|nr:hypothetical protein [Streptomyces sp. BE20]MEE1821988.1 hypothetical protein [Streptomyces sp. BE20]
MARRWSPTVLVLAVPEAVVPDADAPGPDGPRAGAEPGGGAPIAQELPAPCMGNTRVSPGSRESLRIDRYWARASSAVRSGPDRSVRPALPTSRLPPVNTATGRPPSGPSSSTG